MNITSHFAWQSVKRIVATCMTKCLVWLENFIIVSTLHKENQISGRWSENVATLYVIKQDVLCKPIIVAFFIRFTVLCSNWSISVCREKFHKMMTSSIYVSRAGRLFLSSIHITANNNVTPNALKGSRLWRNKGVGCTQSYPCVIS